MISFSILSSSATFSTSEKQSNFKRKSPGTRFQTSRALTHGRESFLLSLTSSLKYQNVKLGNLKSYGKNIFLRLESQHSDFALTKLRKMKTCKAASNVVQVFQFRQFQSFRFSKLIASLNLMGSCFHAKDFSTAQPNINLSVQRVVVLNYDPKKHHKSFFATGVKPRSKLLTSGFVLSYKYFAFLFDQHRSQLSSTSRSTFQS